MKKVYFTDLGLKSYKDVWDLQERKLRHIVSQKMVEEETGLLPVSHLFFTEHPAVYTLGRNGNEQHVLISGDELAKKGIEYFHTNRGGDITFHGPGQLVGYPIFDLSQFKTDVGWYLRQLEEVVIRTLSDYGISGDRSKGETGVWIDPQNPHRARKICAMGIRCSRWVSMHGLALNINTNLQYFNFIIPCGIQNKQVTSLQQELGRWINEDEVKQKMKYYFEEVFEIKLEEVAMGDE
ncbi:MAG: lipoyl(octanoyl) transferase LipB [Bacteroidetes bacterium]|nr:lipoyl(octanoyl) transferase LipB [Bacteroidota bacterium]